MASDKEGVGSKNIRLLRKLQDRLQALIDRKQGNQTAYGKTTLAIVWKAGAVDSIELTDTETER